MTHARKGVEYLPELPILLRDAQPLAVERSNLAAMRRCNIARDILFDLYRKATMANALDKLHPEVRLFCEDMKGLNDGHLPPRRGGRPDESHRRLRICQWVQKRINAGDGVVKALKGVAANEKPPVPWETVRDIWYDRDPKWLCWKKLALDELALANVPKKV